jgi:hypothetical protein
MQRPEGPVEGGDRSRGKEVGISRDSYQSARNARLRDQLSSCPPRVCIEALQNLHIGLDSVVYLYRTSPKIENFEGSPCLVNDIHLALNHGLLLLRILLRYHQEAQAWYVPLLSPSPLKTVPLSRCPSSLRPADQHFSRCHAPFTCLDCSKTFRHGGEWKSHTSCISEAEKYEKTLFKGDKKKVRLALTSFLRLR